MKRYYLNKLTAKQLKELVAWDEKESEKGKGWLALQAVGEALNESLDDCIPFTIGIRKGKPCLDAQYSGPYPATAKARKQARMSMTQHQKDCDDFMRAAPKGKLYLEKII